MSKGLEHLAFAYYRRMAENGGFLRDFKMQADTKEGESHPHRIKLTATIVATGEKDLAELDFSEEPPLIDPFVVNTI